MVTKTVSLDRFANEMKNFNEVQIEDYKRAVINALTMAITRLVANSPVDTGLFAQSWDLVISEKSAIIGNYAPHAAIIEFGARPFTPPLRPLLEWARRVLKKGEIDSDCWALAKYTQAKIAEHGMKPRHILTNQLDLIIADIKSELKESF